MALLKNSRLVMGALEPFHFIYETTNVGNLMHLSFMSFLPKKFRLTLQTSPKWNVTLLIWWKVFILSLYVLIHLPCGPNLLGCKSEAVC